MEVVDLSFTVQKPFGNLHRRKVVLIAVEDADGNILVGTKPYQYPPSISRLLGGGVHQGETEVDAAARELGEELSLEIAPGQLSLILQFNASVKDQGGQDFYHQTYVYHTNIGTRAYQANDDVKAILKLSLDELFALGERFEELPETLWYSGGEGDYSWADYGKLYGPVHKQTAQTVKQLRAAR